MLPYDTEETLARAHQGGRAAALPAGRCARSSTHPRRRRMTAGRGRCCRCGTRPGLVDFARGLARARLRARVVGRHRGGDRRRRRAGDVLSDMTGVPEMLEHRVVTLHPKVHGGILADRGKESHRADLERARHRAVRSRGVEPLPVRVERPDIETIDIGGPAMTRAAAKNHAWVGIVTAPDAVRRRCSPSCAPTTGTLGDATRRRLALEAFARTAEYDAAIVRGSRATSVLPEHLVLPLERTDEELRYGENPHQRAARYRHRGHHELVGRRGAAQRARASATSTSTTPTPRGGSCTTSSSAASTQPTCAIIKHANPCGVADRRRPRHRVPARARVRRAVGVRWDRRGEPPARCGHRRAHGRRTAGRRRDRARRTSPVPIEALVAKRKNTRLLEAPAPEPWTMRRPPDLGRVPGAGAAPLRGGARRLAGGHEARADRRASGATPSSRGGSAGT